MRRLAFVILLAILIVTPLTCGYAEAGNSPYSVPDGTFIHLRDRVVTGIFVGYFFVEEPDRSWGIRVDAQYASVSPGDLVEVAGVLATENGQRKIKIDPNNPSHSATTLDSGYPLPRPFGMSGRSIGGGAFGIFTPKVGVYGGAINTGMLVKIWGVVTTDPVYTSDGFLSYYLDDGSNIQNDSPDPGIKVYDLNMPSKGDRVTLTGTVASEIPAGSTASMPILYNIYDYAPPASASGTGTLRGTVAADTSAAGRIVGIRGTGGSTTCTINSSGIGSYTLPVPAGDHTFGADLPGYGRDTAKVSITNGSSTVQDFVLSSTYKKIYAYSTPGRIAPDGISETTVTSVVIDDEGRGLPGQSVTWTSDMGTIQTARTDTVTDDKGEAHMILRSATLPGTATVKAVSGTLAAQTYVEFLAAGAPSILITEPASGGTVGGDVKIKFATSDPGGTHPGVAFVSIKVDGVEIASVSATGNEVYWHSATAVDGPHQIRATATDFDGNTSYSNAITLTSRNVVGEIRLSPQTVGANQPINITAKVAAPYTWKVTVTDVSGVQVWSTNGTGTVVSVTWPGTLQGGIYTATVAANTITRPEAASLPAAVNIGDNPDTLIVATDIGLNRYSGILNDIAKIVRNKSLTYKVLLPHDATLGNISQILSNPSCNHFFIYSTGHWNVGTPVPVTHILLPASKHVLYSQRWEDAPDPESSAPGYPGWKVAYAEDFGRDYYPLSLAWIQSPFSGRIGAKRDDLYSNNSCYEMAPAPAWNDMAFALGITPANSFSFACNYVGMYDGGTDANTFLGGDGFPGLTVRTWSTLSEGYAFEFARNWVYMNSEGNHYKLPRPDGSVPGVPGVSIVAPYYNWRFWGTELDPVF